MLLVFGAVGCAGLAFGVALLLAGDLLGIVAAVLGVLVAFLSFLFTAGVLYRVDRYRGTPTRRVGLFE